MLCVKCYKFRLKPTTEQETIFVQWAGCRRFVWNWALARRKETYTSIGKGLTYNALAADLVKLKRERDTTFLKECQSQVLQQTLMDLDKAFKAFFKKRARFPRFKSRRRTAHSFRIPQNVTVVSGAEISLPKIGKVAAILHCEIEGEVKSATIKQESDGHWYVVFVAHQELPDVEPTCQNPVGIDVGLESLVTLHTGEKIQPPKFLRRGERKLRYLSQKLSRSKKDSQNRGKARIKLAAHHRKMRNQRNDFLHKLSAKIVSKYDTICIEDLNLKGLVRTKLGKSFSDAGLGSLFQMLEYKSKYRFGQMVKVGRFYPSSKTCSDCGNHQHLELSERTWTCNGCGVVHDRDANAAINILSEGLRSLKLPVVYGKL